MDIGCYPINVARWMFDGEPDDVVATVLRDPTFGTDVLTSAVLDFGGRQATFTCSTQIEDDQRVHLIGTAGRLLVEIPFNIPPDRPTRIVLAAGGDPPVAPDVQIIEVPTADPYGVQADAFSTAVREGSPVPLPPVDARGQHGRHRTHPRSGLTRASACNAGRGLAGSCELSALAANIRGRQRVKVRGFATRDAPHRGGGRPSAVAL